MGALQVDKEPALLHANSEDSKLTVQAQMFIWVFAMRMSFVCMVPEKKTIT